MVHESLNFFYVNIGLNAAGITLIPDVPEHPVSEALFNFVGAWGLMFLPVMLTERESAKVGNKVAWWAGIMLLTNGGWTTYGIHSGRPAGFHSN